MSEWSDKLSGKLQEEKGELTDNKAEELKGKAKQMRGQLKGEAEDIDRDDTYSM